MAREHPAHSIKRARAANHQHSTEEPPYDIDGAIEKAVRQIVRHGAQVFDNTANIYLLIEYGLEHRLCLALADALHETHQTLQARLFD